MTRNWITLNTEIKLWRDEISFQIFIESKLFWRISNLKRSFISKHSPPRRVVLNHYNKIIFLIMSLSSRWDSSKVTDIIWYISKFCSYFLTSRFWVFLYVDKVPQKFWVIISKSNAILESLRLVPLDNRLYG